jgi:hypothetical protein
MASRSIETKPHVDSDGVRIIRASGVSGPVWLLALAMVLVGIGVFVIVRPALHGTPEPPAAPPLANADANGARDTHLNPVEVKRVQAVPVARVPAPRAAGVDAQPPAAAEPAAATKDAPAHGGVPPSTGGQNAAADVDEHDEPSGLAVFPPPGTKPIKRGILVPEDFELPPGYVRHYQATDDGQRVPAILMLHPDFHPLDEHGEPIALPADRVVPREMAPPGMPIQMLEVPESQGPKAEAPADQDPQDSPP